MAERRDTMEASSRGITEIASQLQERPPPVPLTDNKIAERRSQWVFSSSVIIVLTFTALTSFATSIDYFYITDSFVPCCLPEGHVLIIQNLLDKYFEVHSFLGLALAILADNYVKKEWLVKIMMAIGAFSSVVLCFLATICAQYTYSKSTKLKEDLFFAFVALQSLNELTKPLLLSLLLDQIVHLKNFTIDTSKIFSIVFLIRELSILMTYCLAIYTTKSKTAAAVTQIIPPILSQGSVYIFIFITWWKYPLNSYPLNFNGIWKIIGCLQQSLAGFVVKTVLHFRTYRPLLIGFSETTRKESKMFLNMILALVIGLPYYYCLDLIAKCAFSKRALTDPLQIEVTQKVYDQALKLGFLIFIQFFIFPLAYRTKLKHVLSSPMHWMAMCYGIVGLCGLASFIIVSLHQRSKFHSFVSKSSKIVSITNIFNDTINVELSMSTPGWEVPIRILPYERHMVILEKSDPLQMSVVNKKLGLDDYYELNVKNYDDFVVCEFGLEKVEMNESADKGSDKYISRIFVLCLMIICRGSIAVECNGRTIVLELYKFGVKYKAEVNKFSKCKIIHYNHIGTLNGDIEFEFTASEPVYYFAAVEDMKQDVTIQVLSRESTPQLNIWLMVPFDLISTSVNMGFEISYCQFILVETPISCRTIIAAVMYTYRSLAHMCSSRFVIQDGMISERNALIFTALYFVGFIWFLTRMPLFNVKEHIKDIYSRGQDEMKFYQNAGAH